MEPPPERRSNNKLNPSNHLKPRSILKKDRQPKRRSLIWDEANLSLNEAQKTPKMKIDEPKTPYHHDSGYIVDDESMEEAGRRSPPEMHQSLMSQWDEVVSKMEKVQAKQMGSPKSASSPSTPALTPSTSMKELRTPKEEKTPRTSESGSESDSEKKHKDFATRRKAHYNEFQVLKKIGSVLPKDEEEEANLEGRSANNAPPVNSAAASAAHAMAHTPSSPTSPSHSAEQSPVAPSALRQDAPPRRRMDMSSGAASVPPVQFVLPPMRDTKDERMADF